MRDFLHDIEPGTWPNWLAAIGTTLAFLIAAVSFSLSVYDKRRAQARLVYSKNTFEVYSEGTDVSWFRGADYGKCLGVWASSSKSGQQLTMKDCVIVEVTAHNASNGLISNVEIEVLTRSEDRFPTRYVYNFDVVDPESARKTMIVFPRPNEFSWNDLLTQVTYTDSAGKHWVRKFAGPVRRVRKDRRDWPIVGPTITSDAH